MSFTSRSDISTHLGAHFQREQETFQQLLKLEKIFREHNDLTLKEMRFQKDLIDRMWVLSQRHIMLVSTGSCCKYPDIYAAPTEDVILHEYTDKLRLLRSSSCRLTDSLRKLRKQCCAFEALYAQLDLTVESPFILGDTFHKPISFFHELVGDLFKYLHALALKLKYLAHQLEPADLLSLEEYKTALEPSEDFQEYLMMGLSYCKCLREKPTCPM